MHGAFEPDRIERAVEIQGRAYALLRWMESALPGGVIQPERGSEFASESQAARDWIERHQQNFPPAARPPEDQLEAFANYFSCYLKSSYDLEPNPGEVLYSEQGHCFCPFCSWMVRRKHLRPKKVTPQDKRKARRFQDGVLRQIALDAGIEATEERFTRILDDNDIRDDVALCAYLVDVQQRMTGRSSGPVSLVLWRSFAYDERGTPRRKFQLRAKDVLSSHALLVRLLG